MNQPIIGIIGLGSIGTMLVKASRAFDTGPRSFVISSPQTEVAREIGRKFDARVASNNAEAAASADIIFVCVPPKSYLSVVEEISAELGATKILVSVTNGVTLDAVEGRVSCPVARIIPSVAHSVGRGVSLATRGRRIKPAQFGQVVRFLSAFARVVEVTPEDVRAATNITGCGPALFSYFCSVLEETSAKRCKRLTPMQVKELVSETFAATGRLIDDGESYQDIMRQAATGGGMTQTALESLAAGLPKLFEETIEATFTHQRKLQAAGGR